MITVNVAKDFSRYPSGRYTRHGNTSGESFREKYLLPAIERGERIRVELDGTIGYGSSFLEEAFGGLVRRTTMPMSDVDKRLELISSNEVLLEEIRQYISEAKAKKSRERS